MDKKPKTFSWDEFKAKVAVENKMSREVSQKSDQGKIDAFLKNYEKKAEAAGSVYRLQWNELEAHNKKFGKWHRNAINVIASSNKEAFSPHPGIKYVSFGNESIWFMGTSNRQAVKWNLSKTGEKVQPFVVEDGSLWYVEDFVLLRKKIFKDFSSFEEVWNSSKKLFKGKGFYAVSYKTMFVFKGKTNINSYRGSLSEEKFLEMREILKKSSKKGGNN